ncbi:hypothetical protein SCG7109_AQ_00110 [Chlamydiales bacterium SCGC AG-110-M15]|nr:hypothetical protein SCG7109_AQ_00110 [Chlamydiales bacterium SCGC AG-110-M15]
MRHLFYCLLFFIVASCSSTKYWDTTAHMVGNMNHPVIPIYKKYENYLNQNGLIHVSSGVTEQEKEKKIESFHQMTISRSLLTQEKARLLLVNLVNELVDRINEDEAMRSHLIAHPISSSRIHYTLLMTDEKGGYVPDHDYIAKVTLRDGLVRYFAHGEVEKINYRPEERQPEDDPAHIVELTQEPFREALKVVKKPEKE